MVQEFVTGITLIFVFMFFSSRLHKKHSLTPSPSVFMKSGLGIVHGLMGIVIMFFSVPIHSAALLDMRHILLILAALSGGLLSAIIASVCMFIGRNLIFGPMDLANFMSALTILIIGLGSGIISLYVKSYWKKWAYSLLLTMAVISLGLHCLLGFNDWPILAPYLTVVLVSGIMAAWLLHFLIKSNERTTLNELIADLIPKMKRTNSSLELFTLTMKEIGELFSCDAGEVILTEKNRYRTVFRYMEDSYESINQMIDSDELEGMLKVLNGGPVLFDDWNKKLLLGSAHLPLFEQGIRSSLHLPISYNNKLIAIITLASKTPEHFSHKEMIIAQQLIPLISITMALKNAEGTFSSVFNTSQDAIIVLDNDSNIELWNDGAELIYGYSRNEVIGRHVTILIPERLHSFYMNTCYQLRILGMNEHAGNTIELTALRKDGSELPVEMSLNCWQAGGVFYFSSMIRDITARKRTEHEISSLKQELVETLRYQHGMIMKFKKMEGKYVCTLADGQMLYDLGFTPEQVVGVSIDDLAGSNNASMLDAYDRAWNGDPQQFEYTYSNHTYLTSLNLISDQGQVVEIIATSSDITHRKQMESELIESEERYRKLIEFMPDGIIIHCDGTVVQVNQMTLELLAASNASELIGKSIAELLHPDSAEDVISRNREILLNQSSAPPSERVYIRLDGQYMNVEASGAWVSYKGKPAIMTVFRDITERKRAELQLYEANEMFKKLSMIDGLTGIANRRYFEESYQMIWKQALQHSNVVSILLLDIDFFKIYNDTYGHQGGDTCLKQVASALDQLATRHGCFAARYGGEEFVCILPDTHEAQAREFAVWVREEIGELAIPHAASTVSGHVTVSIGIAAAVPNPLIDRNKLIEQADQALYKAKMNGRNQIAS
ncbi:PAS domain S-box protein [Paenibacillus radicis (ex Xue et al. 2023)]|uniref:PAS domain S-box protein n=1 Tax=Paenibacillus radicis (ex Xue et al. 2023) TaxID=2972489 RepID=A0ABT1YS71_9BACL|nr:PAS domain S-box protein [Paenibacillus radicis (ex Xue et al. 2023)]MCR8636024.1 PAS domain S-box protein [Paenibacillus radicis (ex Xue et al. 2023)]